MLVRREFQPATSRSADRRSPNWVDQATVNCIDIQLLRERLSEKMCTRQSRKVIWDMINTLVPNTDRIHTRDGLFSKFITYYSQPVKHIKSILRKLLLPLALLHKSLVVLVFPLQFRPRLLPRNIIQHSFLSSTILQLMSQTGTFFSRIYRKTTMGEAKEWLKPKVNRLWTMNLIDGLGKKSKNRDLRYKRL